MHQTGEIFPSVAICSQQAGPDKMVSTMIRCIPRLNLLLFGNETETLKCRSQTSEHMENFIFKLCR